MERRHIWITDADNAALTALAETTYCFRPDYEADYGSSSVQMMDLSGAVYRGRAPMPVRSRAPLYQLGRRTPFP